MRLRIKTDGGARGNPGPAGAGVAIWDEQGQLVLERGFFLGRMTNNQAEYEGLLRGLDAAGQLGADQVEVYCDSELLVKQINGEYRVKNAELKKLFEKVVGLQRQFESVRVRHIRRSENVDADKLANLAMDAKADVNGKVSEEGGEKVGAAGASGAGAQEGDCVRQVVQLRDLVRYNGAKPSCEVLHREGRLTSELICLKGDQEWQMGGKVSQGTITVMYGSGTIEVDGQAMAVAAGCWLHVERVGAIRFRGNGRDDMTVIVSYQS
ncbi:MAG: ribonuclease HI family protein [Sedimentisphaerales bacterium]|nr:ribonuclease HI family protein [Sedimentisphaerales bacterium]